MFRRPAPEERIQTRERVLRAALQTLAAEGYGATTARAVARTGGFAPGVIYYHFNDLEDLLLAALQYTSQRRLERYRAELGEVTTATDLLRRLRALYAEDIASGHTAAVQELIAGASSSPRLRQRVVEQVEPWLELADEVGRRFLAGTPFPLMVPTRELARAAVALYLGMEMLTHLTEDRSPAGADALFDAAAPAAALFDALRPAPSPPSPPPSEPPSKRPPGEEPREKPREQPREDPP